MNKTDTVGLKLTKAPGGRWQDLGKVGSSSVCVTCEDREYGYRIGYVSTPDGVVGLYDQVERSGTAPYTALTLIVGGRLTEVSWTRTFSNRRLITLARAFAAGRIALGDQP